MKEIIPNVLYRSHIEMKLLKLRDITKTQCSKGNYDQGEYMRGLANGLILANSIFNEENPKYIDSQSKEK